jgi:hypothetical protein
MSQAHFTLSFRLKSPADAEVVPDQLTRMMPALFQAAAAIGTIHASRFTIPDKKTLLFLGDCDGDVGELMADLAKLAGPVFDVIFRRVENPPSTPVADNSGAFVEWTARHRLQAVTLFSAYPDVTVKEIKALAAAAGVSGGSKQLPFLVILPIKSPLAYIEVQLLLRARSRKTQKDLAAVGTPHFAQFVPLGDDRVGFFTVYDGSFNQYIADFTKYMGPVFDLLFKFTKEPPPTPCRKYVQEFTDYVAGANHVPIAFYQAYPGLTVQDIRALRAEAHALP